MTQFLKMNCLYLPLKQMKLSHQVPVNLHCNIDAFVNVIDEKTGMKGRRETNTMPQWAGSCWYYLRYIDPHNEK